MLQARISRNCNNEGFQTLYHLPQALQHLESPSGPSFGLLPQGEYSIEIEDLGHGSCCILKTKRGIITVRLGRTL